MHYGCLKSCTNYAAPIPRSQLNGAIPPYQCSGSTLLRSVRCGLKFRYTFNKTLLLVDVLIHKYSFCSNNFNIILPLTQLNLGPRLRMSGAILLIPPMCLYVVSRDNFTCVLTLRSPTKLSFPFIKILYAFYMFCPFYNAVISVMYFTL
jgi:hypothetical protein